MLLRQFLILADDVHPEEVGPFAHLTQQYIDAREAGKRGLVQQDVLMEQVEHLIQLFDFDPATGTYVHPGIDGLIPKSKPGPKETDEAAALFPDFWAEFPRKVAKETALRAWKSKVRTMELARKAIAAVKVHIRHYDWTNPERASFIPHASTWINQKRWDDELVVTPSVSSRAMPRDVLVGVR